jgi:hypothetical protein
MNVNDKTSIINTDDLSVKIDVTENAFTPNTDDLSVKINVIENSFILNFDVLKNILNVDISTKKLINVDILETDKINIKTSSIDLLNFDILYLLNFNVYSSTSLNCDLSVYDDKWPFWRILLDFIYSHDSDIFGFVDL